VPTGSEAPAAIAGPLYCDASALAKLYLPEPESDALNGLLAGREDALVSDLAITEVVSALGRRVRRGELGAEPARRVHRKILAHLAEGLFRKVELLTATHREAERILLAARTAGIRSADALHLALALGAGAGTLLTYDRTMAKAALEQSLAVWPEPGP
jgi:predicted nucleic acid-binding protein